jgi:hypothetical protein
MATATSSPPETTRPGKCRAEEVSEWAGDRVSELMGVINAATAELVGVIAHVVESEAWGGPGLRSPEHWVGWRACVSPGRARSLVRSARSLSELPYMASLFAQGLLSEDTVATMAGRVPTSRDTEVSELARIMTISQLRRILSCLPEKPSKDETDREPEVSFGTDGDGWSLRAKGLPPELGALVQKALEAARDAEFADRHPDADAETKATGIGWDDALVRMSRAALDNLDPATAKAQSPANGRYAVVVHVDQNTDPAAYLHLGGALSDAARRRITCECDLRWLRNGKETTCALLELGSLLVGPLLAQVVSFQSLMEFEGKPVGWGRSRRNVSPTLRRIIENRDRGCRVPGCTQVRWCEVHHLVHVEDGGLTEPGNLALLCPNHHDAHHRGRLGIEGDPESPTGLVFRDRHGRVIPPPTPTPPNAAPAEAANALGIRNRRFVCPIGEPLHADCFFWN